MRKFLLSAASLLLLCLHTTAQYNEFNPDYKWLTIDEEHVSVHFHEGAERTASVVAKIAEEVWGPITNLYHYEPERVHFVIKDIDDYANGATYFFDNKIEIWASALDFDLRGSHNWLRNVISHEFTHMVQIQAGMKTTRSIPAVYLQFLNYEDKRRPDILYGYPNFIASYPIPMINIPSWFAEGTAQYMRKEFQYDTWDSHRDMILRSYALDNKMLTWNEMGVFNKTSLGNESVYNAGFALTRYISQKYGEDKLREITYALGKFGNFTMDAAIKDVLGISGQDLYDEWSGYLKKDYAERTAAVEDNFVAGDTLMDTGFGNFYPVFSEDGKSIYYVSNKKADYFGLSVLFKYDIETKLEKAIAFPVQSTISYIPGENKIVYAKLSDDNPKSVKIHDIYYYDMGKEKEERITYALRANNPTVSPDGKKIAFTFQKDGTSNIGIVNVDGSDFKSLTLFRDGEQVYNPQFSPDGDYIIFDHNYSSGRDIAKVNTDGSGFGYMIQTDADERDGVIDTSGNLIYSSDETGIFNLYKKNLTTGETTQLTNVTGGAFMPSVNKEGDIVYAGYTSGGYKIFYITPDEMAEVDPGKSYVKSLNPPLGTDIPDTALDRIDVDRLKNFDDYTVKDYETRDYHGSFTKPSFFPFIRYDNYNTSNDFVDRIKPGFYVTSSDMLNRFDFFAGGSINKRMERDLFLNVNYRDKLPLLYSMGLKPELSLELYSISRKADVDLVFDSLDAANNTVGTDVTYNLFEVDIAAKHKLFNDYNSFEFRYIYSQYVATLGSFILPNSNSLYPTTNDKYFIGSNFQITLHHKFEMPNVDTDINPVGREIEVKYNYELNRFNEDGNYEVEDGYLKPLYDHFYFSRLEVNWLENIQVRKGHTLSARFRVGTIFGPTVPDFFDFYLGGLTGMRAYPFYAVSGNELGWANLTYRFPLFQHIDTKIGHLYLDKVFFSVHGDFGNAWYGDMPELSEWKKGAGFEFRVKMNSFYLFPTSLFFDASYSFDEFTNTIRNEQVTYGKEWRFYGGILFDFSL